MGKILNRNSEITFNQCPKIATQLIELLQQVSVQMEIVMLQNGIPADMAKEDVATFMRGGTGALYATTDNPVSQNDWWQNPLLMDTVIKIL
jgi:sulfur transfer complex TusBCD TusB component (DsrH family)